MSGYSSITDRETGMGGLLASTILGAIIKGSGGPVASFIGPGLGGSEAGRGQGKT